MEKGRVFCIAWVFCVVWLFMFSIHLSGTQIGKGMCTAWRNIDIDEMNFRIRLHCQTDSFANS